MLKNKSAKTIFIICKILNDSFMYMCVYIYIYIHTHGYTTHIYTHTYICFYSSQFLRITTNKNAVILVYFTRSIWIINKLYSSSRYQQYFCPLKINDRDEFCYKLMLFTINYVCQITKIILIMIILFFKNKL